MLLHAKFVELAQAEFDAAVEYHEAAANKGAAFTREVRRVISLATEFPASGTLVPIRRVKRRVRLYRLNPEFPYDLVATVIEEEDLLLVIAVAHHKRRPKYWISRLRTDDR
jgi:toxin ParE1/3/4